MNKITTEQTEIVLVNTITRGVFNGIMFAFGTITLLIVLIGWVFNYLQ